MKPFRERKQIIVIDAHWSELNWCFKDFSGTEIYYFNKWKTRCNFYYKSIRKDIKNLTQFANSNILAKWVLTKKKKKNCGKRKMQQAERG